MAKNVTYRPAELRKSALHSLKVVVLALWFGGGLGAGCLAPLYLQHRLGKDPQWEGRIDDLTISGINLAFSPTMACAGAVPCLVPFFLEEPRRAPFALFLAMVVVALVNQYAITNWISSNPVLRTVYQAVFFSQVLVAGIYLTALSVAGSRESAPSAVA